MMRALTFWAVVGLLLCPATAFSQAAPIARYARWVGNYDYVATGGSLRSSATNACQLRATSSNPLTLPAGATVRAAYLYWGGSGATVDASVTLNGVATAANRTFTTTGAGYAFFGGFADVTSRVTASGTLTFGGLTVDSSNTYCSVAAVQSGWAIIVIYERAVEPLRAINVFDGLQSFYGSQISLTPDGFRLRPAGNDGKMTVVTWEGDPANSGASGGFSEALRYNGTLLDDGLVPSGSNPAVQQFDGTVNTLSQVDQYGVDVDTYTLTPYLVPGATSATTQYSSGQDLVLLTAQVVSVTSDPVVDLQVQQVAPADLVPGTNATFTINVANAAGREREDNPVIVTDVLPAGLTFVSASGTGWTCVHAAGTVTCTRAPPLAAGTSAPPITLVAGVATSAPATITHTVSVDSASFDGVPANDTSSVTLPVRRPALAFTKLSEVLSDPVNGTSLPKRIPGSLIRYTLGIANTGTLPVDAGSLAIADVLPPDLELYVGAGAVEFVDGTPASGLGFTGPGIVTYSNRPGGAAPFDYTPVPDAQGFDPAVTALRLAPTGTLGAASVAGNPGFSARFRARVR